MFVRAAFFIILFSAPVISWATPIVFTDYSAWLAALPTESTILTEEFNQPLITEYPGARPVLSGTDLGLFTLYHNGTADPQDLWNGRLNLPVIYDDSGIFGVKNIFSGDLSHEGADGRATYYDFNFNAELFGFGATYTEAADAQGLLLTVNGVTLDFHSILGGRGDGFFGIIDFMQPITSARYSVGTRIGPNEAFLMDDLVTATADEPTIFSLFLLAIVVWRKTIHAQTNHPIATRSRGHAGWR